MHRTGGEREIIIDTCKARTDIENVTSDTKYLAKEKIVKLRKFDKHDNQMPTRLDGSWAWPIWLDPE